MRILAVAPKSEALPIGIACVIAVWKQAGHHVDAINLSLVPDWEVRKGDYDFVATGGLACHYSGLREILEHARATGIPTILGGGIVTSGSGGAAACSGWAPRWRDRLSGPGFFRWLSGPSTWHRKPCLPYAADCPAAPWTSAIADIERKVPPNSLTGGLRSVTV